MRPPLSVQVTESIFLYIFTFELTVKIIAYGFLMHKHSYLRDAWCQLDFVVVSLAWVPIIFPQMTGMGAVRSVRALRPLRALRRVPGMPVLVSSILQSLPALGNVAGLTFFLFLVFGIIGMNLFQGALHYRCADMGIFDLDNPPAPVVDGVATYTLERRLGEVAPSLEQLASGAAASLAATSVPAFKELMSAVGNSVEQGVAALTKKAPARVPGRQLKGGGGGGGGADPDDLQAQFDTETLCAAEPGMCAEDGTKCFYFTNNPGGGTISFDNVAVTGIAILMVRTPPHRSSPPPPPFPPRLSRCSRGRRGDVLHP